MRYPAADSFPAEKVAEGMFSVFETWIDVWAGAEGAIDADWDAGVPFPPFEHSDVIDGQTPETIADVKVRTGYESHLGGETGIRPATQPAIVAPRTRPVSGLLHRHARQIPKTSAVTNRLRTQAGRISDPMLVQAITP